MPKNRRWPLSTILWRQFCWDAGHTRVALHQSHRNWGVRGALEPVQVGHETIYLYSSSGNGHSFTKSSHHQTYQNYEQSRKKLGRK